VSSSEVLGWDSCDLTQSFTSLEMGSHGGLNLGSTAILGRTALQSIALWPWQEDVKKALKVTWLSLEILAVLFFKYTGQPEGTQYYSDSRSISFHSSIFKPFSHRAASICNIPCWCGNQEMEQQLSKTDFLVSSFVTLADIVLAPRPKLFQATCARMAFQRLSHHKSSRLNLCVHCAG